MLGDIDRRLYALETLLANLVRVGEVTAVFPDRHTVHVQFVESSRVVTAELPVLTSTAHKVKAYRMPDVGEPVLCVFLPRGREAGFVLGAFYTSRHTPPVASGDKRHMAFDDGTWIEYDRALHRLTGHVQGDVQLDVSGDVEISVGGNREITISGNQDQETHGDKSDTVGGNYTISVQGNVVLNAATVELRGGNGGEAGGIVQKDCLCAFTGAPHPMISATVKGSM